MTEKLSTSDATRMDMLQLNAIAPFFIIHAFKNLLAETRGPGATSHTVDKAVYPSRKLLYKSVLFNMRISISICNYL